MLMLPIMPLPTANYSMPTIDDVLTGQAKWTIGNCNGFTLAGLMIDGAVDHVIGDPPYDEKTHSHAKNGFRKRPIIGFDALPPPYNIPAKLATHS